VFENYKTLFDWTTELFEHDENDCVRLMENAELMRDVRSAGYEFAIMDIPALHCYLSLPYSLGIPYAMLSFGYFTWTYRVPRLASFSTFCGFGDRMTFVQRLLTFFVEMLAVPTPMHSTAYVEKYAPERPPIGGMELTRGASLWFYLEDLATGYPMPLMPNTVAVGDIASDRFIRPLSDPLVQFMKASSTAGVVVVSFGSLIDFVPARIMTTFCDSFRGIRSRGLRVVWKLKMNSEAKHGCNLENVMILPWIPQNDLLADPRVRLFISHGGLNSLVESVYHAKPLIIFPFAFDQPANAVAAESKGYAIRMNIAEFTSDELIANIEQILNNATYRDKAELASRILRDKPDTAAERAGRMIEHVIKYGDRHLRTGAFDLSPMQFMMFDIFAVIFLIVTVLASGIAGIAYSTSKMFKGGCKRIVNISISQRQKLL
jgi:hypothetical protein